MNKDFCEFIVFYKCLNDSIDLRGYFFLIVVKNKERSFIYKYIYFEFLVYKCG